jgi:uncharacterized Zn-finger protein
MPKGLVFKDVRFEVMDLSKQPNPAAAIELIAQVPVKEVDTNIVACEGGGNLATGHPKIYINLVSQAKFALVQCLLRVILLGSKQANFVHILRPEVFTQGTLKPRLCSMPSAAINRLLKLLTAGISQEMPDGMAHTNTRKRDILPLPAIGSDLRQKSFLLP